MKVHCLVMVYHEDLGATGLYVARSRSRLASQVLKDLNEAFEENDEVIRSFRRSIMAVDSGDQIDFPDQVAIYFELNV